MRLVRLDLTRYGKFTGHRIDFGPREPGRPDLHVVYGPNEAGKSTTLSAWLDLLFGIEPRSRFDFLHPYPTMQIGAALEQDGVAREIVRIKRPQNSLLDARGEPIGEGAFFAELGGIDRDAYRTMFSLDDETLESGGNSILASKGELGQLLFAASAGLADLSQRLASLQSEADGFYKFRARSGELSEQKARLATLRQEKDAIDTLASAYGALVATRDSAAAGYAAAIEVRGRTKARLDAVRRILGVLPRLPVLQRLRAELAPLAELPEPPAGWLAELPLLQKQSFELTARKVAIDDEIRRLDGAIETIVVDDDAAALAGRLDRLGDLRARYQTAAKDLPTRGGEWNAARLEIALILRSLERENEADPASLLLPATTVARLRKQITERSGIDASLAQATKEHAAAERRLAEARVAIEEAGGEPRETGRLLALLASLRASDHRARFQLAERECDRLSQALAERIARLDPWSGDGEALARMPVPEPAALEGWKRALDAADVETDRHRADIERSTTEALRHRAEIGVISQGAGPADDAEAARIRAAREAAWAAHRLALDDASAEGFERRLREDDAATSLRLAQSADLARLRQARHALALAEAMLARSSELQAQAEARRSALLAEIASAVQALSPRLPADMTLPTLSAWLQRRDKALEVRDELVAVEQDRREASGRIEAARAELAEALAEVGIIAAEELSLDQLATLAQAEVDRQAARIARRAEVEALERDQATRREEWLARKKADADWNRVWAEIGATCWLGASGVMPDVATVGEVLAELDRLRPAVEREASLADRIAKMEKDQQGFADALEALGAELGMEADAAALVEFADAIQRRVAEARDASVAFAAKSAELEAAEARRDALVVAIEQHALQAARMTAFFGVETLDEAEAALRHAARRDELRRQLAETEQEILGALQLPSIELAEAALAEADRPALEAEQAAHEARFDDEDRRAQELFAAHSKATDQVEAVGGDDAVARIEAQRRTLLLDIEEKAVRHIRLRLGIVAAEQALRAYRDRHRSSMMTRASEAFRTVSRGVYSGLAAQPDRDTEVLIGIGADGSSKLASEMSKGTRFQLYLALRVAGYLEFARARSPVPFIADDILETFDDFRAEEAFRLFAEMAEVGQVIYLTHHRHLCDIAREACPGVHLHELPGPLPA